MMKELQITVAAPEKPERTYRFREARVRVGRSGDCHLSICHESVPRQLCVAWLEDRGRSVRVEARPHLTNPLLHGHTIVEGGITGKRLDLRVGPVMLRFMPGKPVGSSPDDPKLKRPSRLVLGGGGGILLLIAAVFCLSEKEDAGADFLQRLPQSPFCADEAMRCVSAPACRERARLFVTRARALGAKPGFRVEDQVRAAALLVKAEQLYRASGSQDAAAVGEAAAAAREAVVRAYRRDVAELRRGLRSGGADRSLAREAERVLAYFAACDLSVRRQLQKLIAQDPATKE